MKNLTPNSLRFIPAAFGLVLLAGLLAYPSPATAATQYFDPGATKASPGSGGSGSWNTTTLDWWTSGSSDVAWTANNIADFAGTAGNPTVASGVTVNADGITFATAGYNITGAGTIVLNGTTPIISVPAGSATYIQCVLGGSGYEVTGGGRVSAEQRLEL